MLKSNECHAGAVIHMRGRLYMIDVPNARGKTRLVPVRGQSASNKHLKDGRLRWFLHRNIMAEAFYYETINPANVGERKEVVDV